MKRSETIKEIATALSKAQAEIKAAEKDRENPHFQSVYATLASVWEACRDPLSKHGLSVVQSPATEESGSISLTTLLMHVSGEWIENVLVLAPRDKSPQAAGSAITYGRRYALMAMVGVAPGEDDDGNGANGRPPVPQQEASPRQWARTPGAVTTGSGAPPKAIQPAPAAAPAPAARVISPAPVDAVTKKELDKVMAAASANGWRKEQLTTYVGKAFQAASAAKLSVAQIETLHRIVATTKPDVALAEFETGAPVVENPDFTRAADEAAATMSAGGAA